MAACCKYADLSDIQRRKSNKSALCCMGASVFLNNIRGLLVFISIQSNNKKKTLRQPFKILNLMNMSDLYADFGRRAYKRGWGVGGIRCVFLLFAHMDLKQD